MQRKRELPSSIFENTPVSKKRRRHQKSVHFQENTERISNPSTREDLKNSWYSEYDYSDFKADCIHTLKTVNAVNGDVSLIDVNEVSTRGLEDQIVRCVHFLKRKKRKQFIRLILSQQAISRVAGSSYPMRLRSISECFSTDSRKFAIALGDLDRNFSDRETGFFAPA